MTDFFEDYCDNFNEPENIILPAEQNDFESPFYTQEQNNFEQIDYGAVNNKTSIYDDLLVQSNEEAFFDYLNSVEPILKDLSELLSQTFDIEVWGDPFNDMEYFDNQDDPNSCAIASTSMILQKFGYDFGEEALSDYFQENGVYDPSKGTFISYIDETVNSIAEATNANFYATEIENFTINQIKDILNSGDKILVGLDAFELYRESEITLNDIRGIPHSPHAVELIGIINNNNNLTCVLNDPGFPNGSGIEVPLEKFFNAADKLNFHAIRFSSGETFV
jgi:hypothetical protein